MKSLGKQDVLQIFQHDGVERKRIMKRRVVYQNTHGGYEVNWHTGGTRDIVLLDGRFTQISNVQTIHRFSSSEIS